MKSFKCIISHNLTTTTNKELLDLISYLKKFEEFMNGANENPFSNENLYVKFVDSHLHEKMRKAQEILSLKDIKYIIKDADFVTSEDLLIFELDSNEIPLARLLQSLSEISERRINVAVPIIHMQYSDEVISIDGKEHKYKNFKDQPSTIFEGITDQLEFRPKNVYNGAIPLVPLSSKWLGWPKLKQVLRIQNEDTVGEIHNMFLSVYKLERCL
jgi:hypothetical protein